MSERTIEWADGGNDGTRGVAPHFDEVIHAPIRLRICGLLSASDSVRFDVLRDTLGISDATCSKHLKTLADAGYVAIAKKPGWRGGIRSLGCRSLSRVSLRSTRMSRCSGRSSPA